MKKVRFILWLAWPAAAAAASLLAAGALSSVWRSSANESASWVTLLASAAMLAALVFAVWSIAHVFIALGRLRRHLGWHTKAEKQKLAVQEGYRRGLDRAAVLRARLADGSHPALLDKPWDVMFEHSEVLLMDGPMAYARWYSSNAVYTHSPVIAVGRTSFVAGALVGKVIGSAIASGRTAAAARAMWREQQNVRVLVTDRRIMCHTVNGWLNFWYRDVKACHPDPANSTLVLEFAGYEPLQLHGYDGSGLCVFAIATLHGRAALREHPGLSALPAVSA